MLTPPFVEADYIALRLPHVVTGSHKRGRMENLPKPLDSGVRIFGALL
jgi:hypothetical protein